MLRLFFHKPFPTVDFTVTTVIDQHSLNHDYEKTFVCFCLQCNWVKQHFLIAIPHFGKTLTTHLLNH